MILAGFWQDRKGPRMVATAGALMLASGCLLAALIGDTVRGLVLSYGVLCGLGVGFAYVPPIATCIRWFPERRGLIVGLSVMGSGMGPLLYGPTIERIIGSDPALFHQTIPRTFLVLAAVFSLCLVAAAQFYRVPPPGWRPAGWTPPAARHAAREMTPKGMLGTWQFYALWLLYFAGASVGLTAIGEASPLIHEVSGAGAAVSAGAALGVISVFNSVGRLAWGAVSDRLGRRGAAILMSAGLVVACSVFLRPASGFWPVLGGLCLTVFAYGGYLALMPAATADYYGPANVGANYGLIFSAWGTAGFLVPGYFARVMDFHRAAGSLREGYSEVFTQLALVAAAGLAIASVLARPKAPGAPAAARQA